MNMLQNLCGKLRNSKTMHIVVQQMKMMKVFKKLATCLEFVQGK
jgi:hypothetical protein